MFDLTDLVPSLLPHLPAVAFIVGVLMGLAAAAIMALVRPHERVKPSVVLTTRRVLTDDELVQLRADWIAAQSRPIRWLKH